MAQPRALSGSPLTDDTDPPRNNARFVGHHARCHYTRAWCIVAQFHRFCRPGSMVLRCAIRAYARARDVWSGTPSEYWLLALALEQTFVVGAPPVCCHARTILVRGRSSTFSGCVAHGSCNVVRAQGEQRSQLDLERRSSSATQLIYQCHIWEEVRSPPRLHCCQLYLAAFAFIHCDHRTCTMWPCVATLFSYSI